MTRRLYRVVELVWNSLDNKWAHAGYYERRYYLTRFFAERRAMQLQAKHPNHRYQIEKTR